MRRAMWLASALSFALAVAGCGDDGVTGGSGGEGGEPSVGGGTPEGGGGAAGCPVGSHEDEGGACVATLGAFSAGPELTDARDHHMNWAAKRASGTYLYAAGGWVDMSASVTTIERATIGEDGALGAWETLPTSTNVSGAAMVSTDDVVVFAGGYRGLTPASKAVDIITIGDDGSLADPADGPFMHDARFHAAGILVSGFIYVSGGLDITGTSLASVERASFDGSQVGAWVVEPPMLEERSHHGLTTDGEYLYVTGGLKRVNNDFGNDLGYSTVLRSKIGEDGALGAWEEIGELPVPLAVHASFVHAGQLYVAAGLDMDTSGFQKQFHRAPITEDGLGTWETLEVQLPRPRGHCLQMPIVNGFLYSTGGEASGGSQTESYVARFE